MRPLRLELSGFTAFREPRTVDLADADLFALVGPTGAGKSSLLDAMCFALYGTVPRLDARAVAPVISVGLVEARVRFDFTVGGVEHTAVRVVRRLPRGGGATTKEARLERGPEVVAGNADQVTAAVGELLGLSFDQFSRCVLLPQGDFARLLHDRPADRQQLLVRLLDLGVYERVRGAARSHEARAAGHAAAAETAAASLAHATPEAVAAAAESSVALEMVRAQIEQQQPLLDELTARVRTAEAEAAAASQRIAVLTALTVPADVGEVTEAARTAAERLVAAEAALVAAESARAQAEAARSALGDAAALQRVVDAHGERARLQERVDRGDAVVRDAHAAEAAAGSAVDVARAAVREAESGRERLLREHSAHALAATLVVGEPCPVCEVPLRTMPPARRPAELADADRDVAAARDALTAAEGRLSDARSARTRADTTMEDLRERVATLDAALQRAPGASDAARGLAAIAAADEALAAARADERNAGAHRREAATARDAANAARDRARADLAVIRDGLAASRLAPPAADPDDLAGTWVALLQWARLEAERAAAAEAAAREHARDAAARRAELADDVRRRCAAVGVDVAAGAAPRDAVADALAGARATHERLVADLARADELRRSAAQSRTDEQVASALARHLQADGFERWLLDAALARLAAGASTVLRELSGGQHSLELDAQRAFAVVDHRNADERRSARTLSGGETFLASLALALTLAEQVADLATSGRAGLESIFLDEGFGTLDPETLDVVAAAVEELGASGRTVGLVTHVRDLAERMPVRFEVRRDGGTASVERIDR